MSDYKAMQDRFGSSYQVPEPYKSRWNWAKWLLLIPVLLIQIYVIRLATEDESFDPLGEYPIQQVVSEIPGIEVPSLRVNETLEVRAIKCNRLDREVEVQGERYWSSVDPKGTIIDGGSGVGTRKPGCESLHYENPLPPEVIKRSMDLFAQGKPYVVWKLSGKEKPTEDPDSVTRVWESVTFRVYPPQTG